jgi:hypothetical protein
MVGLVLLIYSVDEPPIPGSASGTNGLRYLCNQFYATLPKFCNPIAHKVGCYSVDRALWIFVGIAIWLNRAEAAALADLERRHTLAPCRHCPSRHSPRIFSS